MPLKFFILEDEIHSGGFEKRDRLKGVLAGHDLTLALSVEEGIEKYQPGSYHLLILDHDMRGRFDNPDHPSTGLQFVKWLVENEKAKMKPSVILHSLNILGKKRMTALLEPEGFQVKEFAFNDKYLQFMQETFGLQEANETR
jgi:hypothetical protein